MEGERGREKEDGNIPVDCFCLCAHLERERGGESKVEEKFRNMKMST